eukprot:8207786-Ditylum_brightwellii.AAC.1
MKKEKELQKALNESCIKEAPSNQMSDISKSKETTSDMMDCDGMSKLEPAKDNNMSSNELSIEDRWKGCTMHYINNVKKDAFGGHW